MKPTTKLAPALFTVLACALGVAVLAGRAASAKEGGPAASAAPASAAPSAEAAPSADAGPAPPSIRSFLPPEEASPRPAPKDWESAAPLSLRRPRRGCTASALREWVRISCRFEWWQDTMGLRVLGGSEEGVQVLDELASVPDLPGGRRAQIVHAVFPVRRGDRRLLAIDTWTGAGWKSFQIIEDTAVAISESWLPGERGPTIVVD